MAKTPKKAPKRIETLTHEDASRKNIPTAEYESVMETDGRSAISVAYERRNPDLDPQLVWHGKDVQDWSDLVVPAPPLFIQEKVHPKVLVDDLVRQSKKPDDDQFEQIDLFADFNGVPDEASRTEFYEHDANWTNRMILGDSLQVMASLAEREGLRGNVQCIYVDPPYGIKFNSNFQWSTTSPAVSDGKAEHITREPEQVKAFRDTWRDGIHSYLTYLRDRLTCARDLLSPTGSVFVQIGDENLHRVRALMDELFGSENFVSQIGYHSTSGSTAAFLANPKDYVLWYARDVKQMKFRRLLVERGFDENDPGPWQIVEVDGVRRRLAEYLSEGRSLSEEGVRVARLGDATSQRQGRGAGESSAMGFPFEFQGKVFRPAGTRGWSTTKPGLERAARAGRLYGGGQALSVVRYFDESPAFPMNSSWEDTGGTIGADKVFVVQTNVRVVQRCILMATDPGDLVLDPTCGSGTAAFVSEQWGRRWITIDTSRVALALARARLMGARYPFYRLSDSASSRSEVGGASQNSAAGVRRGFVYERVPRISLKSIANNLEIDVIWEKFQAELSSLLEEINAALNEEWADWEVPQKADADWPDEVRELHSRWLTTRSARQTQLDAAISDNAEYELRYDKPEEDRKIVRVSGPFTVESLSPHHILGVDENDELVHGANRGAADDGGQDFVTMVLENLQTAGVQQAHKDDKVDFVSVTPWPGRRICAVGVFREGGEDGSEKRAAIFVGPEFGTVARADLVEAAKEAGDAGFDVLVACAFNYEARVTEFDKLGRIPILKARMNADLHMADDLKNTGKGNLFVIFGEPDIELLGADKDGRIRVRVNGVDVFDPSTGDVRSDGPDGIACWFVDTDYNEESFFVRQAYFLGARDPYKALRSTLNAQIDADAWESLHSDTSQPFDKPESKRIAVKVINHLGDEVMKVLRVE